MRFDRDEGLLALSVVCALGLVPLLAQAPPEQRVEIDALQAALDSGVTMLLVDVREDHEVESGSMPGSIHIPLGQLEDRMTDIPKDVRLVFF